MSARFTIIVFADAMSIPLSMMEVHRSTWNRRSTKAIITFSSAPSGICPCATPIVTSGTSSLRKVSQRVDGRDLVVDEEDLPAAVDLASDGLADLRNTN